MRKAIMVLLLASVAAPAFAAPDKDDRRARRAEQAQRADRDDDDGGRRSERRARAERDAAQERRSTTDERRESLRQEMQERRARSVEAEAARVRAAQRSDAPASVRNWRPRERLRETRPTIVQQGNRSAAEKLRQRYVQQSRPAISRVPMQGTQPPARSGAGRIFSGTQRWSESWRSDRRYDWRNHRRRYGSLYNFGYYNDPFGWNYRPFSIGWRMWPSYYGRSYWLNDPWQYRLPYAPAGTRWIRYYDDAILVDTWDGQVVDVIRNFFW